MPITVRSRQVAPQTISQPAQPGAVQPGAPVVEALDIVGRTVSELGKVGVQLEERENVRQAKLAKLRIEEQEKRDRADATDAVTLSKGTINEQLIQYKARQGRNATGITTEYDAFATELFNKTIEGLPTDRSKQLYSEDMVAVNINSHNSTVQHASDENAKVNVSAAESSILNSVQSSTINFENLLSYTIERANIEDQVDILSDLQGWDKETKQRNLVDSMAKLEEGRIQQWSKKDAKVAKELFDINKDIFDVKKQEELEKILTKDDTVQFAQQTVDELEATEPDRTQWDKIVKDIKYPGTPEESAAKRDAVEKRAKSRKKYLDDVDIAGNKAILHNALKAQFKEPNKTKREDMALLLDDPAHIEKALSISDSIDNRLTQDTVTDRPVQAQIYEDIDAGKIKTVEQLMEFYPDLSNADYNRFITELRNKKNPDAKTGFVKYTTAKTAYETMKGAKYEVTDDNKEFMFVQGELDKEAQALGRDLTPTEANKAAARAIVEGETITGGIFGDPNRSLYESVQEGTEDIWVPDINTDSIDKGQERREITNAFKGMGLITDNEALFRLYKKETILGRVLSPKQSDEYNRLLIQETLQQTARGNK